MINRLQALGRSVSGFGLILGSLCFAASLTPSLIPRDFVVQGVLAGIAFGAGYGIGVLLRSVWRYLELPSLGQPLTKILSLIMAVILSSHYGAGS